MHEFRFLGAAHLLLFFPVTKCLQTNDKRRRRWFRSQIIKKKRHKYVGILRFVYAVRVRLNAARIASS